MTKSKKQRAQYLLYIMQVQHKKNQNTSVTTLDKKTNHDLKAPPDATNYDANHRNRENL